MSASGAWPCIASSVPCSISKNRPMLNHFDLAGQSAFCTSFMDGLEAVYKLILKAVGNSNTLHVYIIIINSLLCVLEAILQLSA